MEFHVISTNDVYSSSSDGLLMNDERTVLYRVPLAAKEAEIPSTVNEIASGAFRDCTQLTAITIPEEVGKIAGDAFASSKGNVLSSPNAVVSVRPDTYAYQFAKSHGMKIHIQYNYGDIVTADDKSCDIRITYSYDELCTADYYHCPANAKSSVKIPSSVKIQGETYKVTGVAENAFKDAAKVKKINIGKNITSIVKSSFEGKKKKTIYIKPKKGDIGSVQTALNFALQDKKNRFYIKLPKGKYTGRMYVYSNTTIDMRAGAVLKRTGGAGTMLDLVGSGTKRNKYNAGKNITILGGTIDGGTQAKDVTTLCGFNHLKNVKIIGTTFKYLPKKRSSRNPHMIEFGGCKNVLIKNCRFYANRHHWFNNEAIQLESTYNEKKLSKKDHFKKMKFIKNTFVGAKKYGICLYGYRNVLIKGNKISGGGSLYQNQFSTGVKGQ